MKNSFVQKNRTLECIQIGGSLNDEQTCAEKTNYTLGQIYVRTTRRNLDKKNNLVP